jgi:hypothetical protein
MEKSNLQKAVDLLENNGFRVKAAYEEGKAEYNYDKNPITFENAILLRVFPKYS